MMDLAKQSVSIRAPLATRLRGSGPIDCGTGVAAVWIGVGKARAVER